MERKIVVPEEFPNPKGKKRKDEMDKFNIELMKIFKKEKPMDKDKKGKINHYPKISIEEKNGAVVIVSLSGEKNFKAVTNWMRKHMETYPETRDGFFVKFIDTDNDNRGYKVEVCGEGEKGEKINGINYKISPYIFDKIDNVEKDNAKKIIENFTGKTAEESKIDKINRYFDRRHRQRNISKKIIEALDDGDAPEDR